MNPKETFACLVCKQIQRKPVYLPCLCQSVCHEHIETMTKSDKKQYIKCNDCNENYEIDKNIDLKPNKLMSKQLDAFLFLTEEEKRLKIECEKLLQTIHDCYEDFKLNYNGHESDRYDFFKEIRDNIDIRRHEIIDEVHNLSDNLIDQIKNIEKEFNAQVDETIKCKSFDFKIENEIEKLDEMFRSLTINVSQIKEKETNDERILQDLNEDMKRLDEYKEDMRKNKFEKNQTFKIQSSQIGELKLNRIRGRINNNVKIINAPPVVNVSNVNLKFD